MQLDSFIDSKSNVEIISTETKGFIDANIIYLMINMAQNVSLSATYDAINYVLNVVINKLSKINASRGNKVETQNIELTVNDHTEVLRFENFDLTEKQKDILIRPR